MVVTTIPLFFKTYFGIYKAKSHHLHLSSANARNAKIRWACYAVSQLSFLSLSFVNLISVMFSWHDSNMSSCIFTSVILICEKRYCFLTFPVKIYVNIRGAINRRYLYWSLEKVRKSIGYHGRLQNSYFNRIMNFQKKTLKKQNKK